ncbi:hypothetical protein L1887_59911 [Cichorium endivia]|nr:hypothetical protein L1887_59911 [Cichorium endivia]
MRSSLQNSRIAPLRPRTQWREPEATAAAWVRNEAKFTLMGGVAAHDTLVHGGSTNSNLCSLSLYHTIALFSNSTLSIRIAIGLPDWIPQFTDTRTRPKFRASARETHSAAGRRRDQLGSASSRR